MSQNKEDSPKKRERSDPECTGVMIMIPDELLKEMEKDEYLCENYQEFALKCIEKYLSDKKQKEASDELKKVFDGMIFTAKD